MLIEIHNPEIEALIQKRLETGSFETIEAVLEQALESAPLPASPHKPRATRTGAELVEAMQAMPFPDLDIEPERLPMPVRDIVL